MMFTSFTSLFSNWIFLGFVAGIPLYAIFRGVKVYEVFVEGAKEGFPIILKIIPYLVGMMVAIGMFRASGGFELLSLWLSPLLNKINVPSEIVPLALMRSLSGGASNAMGADLISRYGGDTYISKLAGTLMGSTDTTLYIVAVYFGAIGVYRTRHAVPAGLVADLVSIIAAIFICNLIFN